MSGENYIVRRFITRMKLNEEGRGWRIIKSAWKNKNCIKF